MYNLHGMLATFVSDYPLPQALWTTTGDASEMRSDPLAISKMDSPSAGETGLPNKKYGII